MLDFYNKTKAKGDGSQMSTKFAKLSNIIIITTQFYKNEV